MNQPSKSVVFVTGAFVTHHCWDAWKAHFGARGFDTHAPPHPRKEAEPAELRRAHPRSPIAQNRLGDVVGAYAEYIRRLPEKPILVGHSFGGLMVQLLLQLDLGAAGVAIDSVPPQGVVSLKWSFIRSVTPALGLFSSLDEPYLMSFEHWQYTFANGMPLGEQRDAYERLVVPESKRFARGALTRAARIDFARPHAPLLFIAGTDDHIMPASLNRRNYRRYAKHEGSITDFRELAGRNHLLLEQPHWRETADIALGWLGGLSTRKERVPRPSRPSLELQPT